jgi:hypothetical protein
VQCKLCMFVGLQPDNDARLADIHLDRVRTFMLRGANDASDIGLCDGSRASGHASLIAPGRDRSGKYLRVTNTGHRAGPVTVS